MRKFLKGEKYTINVNGEMKECIYCGREFGEYVFEIVGEPILVFKREV